MLLTHEEIDVHRAWASTLAQGGLISKDEASSVLKACLSDWRSPRARAGARREGASKNGKSPSAPRKFESAEIRCLLPVCTLLLESEGLHAEMIVPQIIHFLDGLHDVLDMAPADRVRCQEAFAAVLVELNAVLRLHVVSEDFLHKLSAAVQELMLKSLQPALTLVEGFTVRHCLIRCMARDEALNGRLPLLPTHAAQVLNWLHANFYQADPASYDNGDAPDDSSLSHIDDSKILAVTTALVDAAVAPPDPAPPGDLHPDVLQRLVAHSCATVRDALQPILASASLGRRWPPSEAASSEGGSPRRKRSQPSAALVRSASLLAGRVVGRLWEAGGGGGQQGGVGAGGGARGHAGGGRGCCVPAWGRGCAPE
eukprot:evm.model.scf_2686.1 EVM.evm.TU.scf_2686.1   scf_2686:8478-12092(+)